jgi:sugar phosphate isomerase/epimerase
MKRREFVSAVGAIALAGAAGVFRTAKDRLDRIGLELYTVRDELARDFEGTLQRVAGLGYREVEFTDYFGRSVDAVRAAVATAGLSAPSAQVPSSDLKTAYTARIDRAKAIGHTYLVCGWVPSAERRSLSDWRLLITLFDRVGQAAHRAGLQFAYHNHDFEFAPVEGRVPYDLLLEFTDPALVQFELDVYWATKGGRNPVDLLGRWPGRFPLLHLKDMASGRQHEFTELGRGIIDFRRIRAQARDGGVRHFYVEQDEGRVPPFERARVGYDYLRALRF